MAPQGRLRTGTVVPSMGWVDVWAEGGDRGGPAGRQVPRKRLGRGEAQGPVGALATPS